MYENWESSRILKGIPGAFTKKIECMHKNVYENLENIASKLDEPVAFDINGAIVSVKCFALGLPTRYKVMHPKYFLFVDKTGENTNMKADESIGGRKLVVPVHSTKSRGAVKGALQTYTLQCCTLLVQLVRL